MTWNFTFFLFLTECSITARIFTISLSFFGRKSIREYFMFKSGAFHGFFLILSNIELKKLLSINTVVIRKFLKEPPQDSFQAQALIQPYVFIAIPRDGFNRVDWANVTGEVLFSRPL